MVAEASERHGREDGRDRWSATQVSLYRDCPRKWALKYIDRVQGPQNTYAALGSYIHTQLEAYLESGRLPQGSTTAITITKADGTVRAFSHDEILAIMLPGIRHLPAPGKASVEGGFELDLGDLGVMVGYIDMQWTEDDGVPIVGDHKTTSGLQWALTADELREDVQATCYAVFKLEDSGADRVRLRWVYYQTNKPKSRKVEVELGLAAVDKSWQSVLGSIRDMKRLRDSGVKAAEAPYDARACDKYGGCPYRNQVCRLSPMDRMRSLTTMATLKEKMQARQLAAAGTTAPAATPAAAPAAAANPAPTPAVNPPAAGAGQAVNPPESMTALARLKARAAGAPATAPAAAATQPPAPSPAAPAPAQPSAAVAPAAPPAAVRPTRAAKAAKPTPAGFTLFIDCAPNHECVDFAVLVAPVLRKIEQEAGKPYKLIEGLFGGNGALFASELANYLDANPPPGDVMVTLASPVVRDAFEVLTERAAMVVRGF